MTLPDDLGKPMPGKGWSRKVTQVRNAVIVPPVTSGLVQEAGVFDQYGTYCGEAALWRKSRPLTIAPPIPEGTLPRLRGKWLWGGVLWQHFGHFLTESTGRLWALGRFRDEIDGILFIPKRPKLGDAIGSFPARFIALMGGDVPVRVVTEPTVVGRLIVPGQGFGLGRIASGTPEFRAAMQADFARGVKPDGPERLYISRSHIGLARGGILGEGRLEACLADQGYEIFHPQEHPAEVQIARYRAARQVIGAEGSALHLFAMAGHEGQQVAMILRRRSAATGYLERHINAFCGQAPLAVDALLRSWMPEGAEAKRLGLAELDFPRVQAALAEGGFVDSRKPWTSLGEDEARALIVATPVGRRKTFHPVEIAARTEIAAA